MDINLSSILLLSFLILSPLVIVFLFQRPGNEGSSKNLPPGPPSWPVFGHMFSLGTLPHVAMAKMKDKYGPVIWLKLGSINTMVVLTADAAAELFKNHDLSFSDRILMDTMRCHDYHKSTMAFSPHGPYWRSLRRLSSTQMFSVSKINETAPVRRRCVDEMLSWIEKEASMGSRRGILVAHFVFLATFNVFGEVVLSGRDLVQPDSIVGTEFFTAMNGFFKWAGCPNVSDMFSFLKPFDLQGLRRKMDRDMGKALEIASEFVKERIEERRQHGGDEKRRGDFLDVLLEFEGKGGDEPEKLTEQNISVLVMEIFFVSVSSTTSTIEWAFVELLRSPEKLKKAKDEILKAVGPNRRFEESDIGKVPFLQAVIKETLRLHPPGPLIPRRAVKDTMFMGYDIPKGTNVMINAWAIGKDSECWDEALAFKPERFLTEGLKNIDFKGQHFELIPFGAGRRMCVGLPIATRMMYLQLGSLIHEFDWELEDSTTSDTLDMREEMGLAVRKLEPLRAIPRKRVGYI